MKISVDAMGGDYAPSVVIIGAIKAVHDFDIEVILVGNQPMIEAELKLHNALNNPKLSIVHAEEEIKMGDHPSEIVRGKRKSSMHIGMKLVKDNKADAFFSAGNSGAVMAVAMVTLGLLEGVTRPAIGNVMPSEKKPYFMLDVGANVDCKPEHLLTFAIMGQAYAKHILNIENPKVGLLSNGEEEGKGDMLTKSVYPLLKGYEGINFVGNVEGKALYKGDADVVVCDGFAGNIAIKVSQAISKMIFHVLKKELMSSWRTKLGAFLCKPAFINVKKLGDSSNYGGAPLLGVKGVCIIGHGSSNDLAIYNGIRVAKQTVESNVNQAITEDVKEAATNILNSKYFL